MMPKAKSEKCAELETGTERIASAAVRYNGTVYTLPPPARHHNVLWLILESFPDARIEPRDQGFVTTEGRFVMRRQAAGIALSSGQIEECKFQPGYLFSEDVW